MRSPGRGKTSFYKEGITELGCWVWKDVKRAFLERSKTKTLIGTEEMVAAKCLGDTKPRHGLQKMEWLIWRVPT